MTWRVAHSLDVLLDEVNAAAPNRSKISDGSIGDAAHASRSSDHNPWVIDSNGVGVVRARDFTHDPVHGCDAGVLAERVRQRAMNGHPALGAGAYVIWNREIASATYGWAWRPYSGSNPHDHHCHVSVATAASGYDSTSPWGVTNQEDIMATLQELGELLDRKLAPLERKLDASRERERLIRARANEATRRLERLEAEVKDDATKAQIRAARADISDLEAALAPVEDADSA